MNNIDRKESIKKAMLRLDSVQAAMADLEEKLVDIIRKEYPRQKLWDIYNDIPESDKERKASLRGRRGLAGTVIPPGLRIDWFYYHLSVRLGKFISELKYNINGVTVHKLVPGESIGLYDPPDNFSITMEFDTHKGIIEREVTIW